MSSVQTLQRLQQAVEQAKTDKAQLEGRLSQSLTNLEKEFEVKTVKEGQKLLTKLKKEEAQLEQEIQQGLQELETQFTW